MNKLMVLLSAAAFALAGGQALAADAAKDTGMAKSGEKGAMSTKLEKPASVTQEAWDKMSDADKKKAVDKAMKEKASMDKGSMDKGTMKGADKSAAAPKKEKKGGC